MKLRVGTREAPFVLEIAFGVDFFLNLTKYMSLDGEFVVVIVIVSRLSTLAAGLLARSPS